MSFIKQDASMLSMPLTEQRDSLSFRRRELIRPGTPEFNFVAFFSGHTRVNGWFSDRFGRPRRHFCGDFYGVQSRAKFELQEELYFSDGIIEQRLWSVEVSPSGQFTAQSDTLLGEASGRVQGDSLHMEYRMRVLIEKDKYWNLDMKDTMVLQTDGSLHNITHVYKWGVRIGTVSAIYLKHDG